MHRRLTAAVALGATLLLGACTDDAPKPPPPPPSGPRMESQTPTPTPAPSPTPSNDADKRITEAIVRSYEGQFTEFNRLDMAGGVDKPTRKLLDTTSGSHRKSVMTALREDKRDGIRALNAGRLIRVAVGGGSSHSRHVTACEDYTKVTWVKANGKPLQVDQPIINVQHSIAKKGSDGKWRIDYNQTDHVKNLRSAICRGDGK